jgi:signal transduction histidine kinase/ligand-binding sensor domain-containing protein
MKFLDCWRITLLLAALYGNVCAFCDETPRIDRLRFNAINEHIECPDSLFLDMLQDEVGMIWILTRDALIRFDGYGFKAYSTRTEKTQGQIDPYRQSLFIDRDDNIWVARGTVVSRFDRTKAVFEHFILEEREGLSGISGMTQNRAGEIYVLSSEGKLFRYDEKQRSFPVVMAPGESIACYSFQIDRKDRLWVGGESTLYRYDPDTQHIEEVFKAESVGQFGESRIYSIQPYKADQLLLGTQKDGLILLDPDTGEFEAFAREGWICRVVVDRSDNIYFGGASGVTILENDTHRAYDYTYDPGNPDSILPGAVWSILIDNENNLWAATSRSGLLVAYADIGFENLNFKTNWTPIVPQKDNVSSIFEDSRGNLWLGYLGNGVEMLDYSTGKQWFLDCGKEDPGKIGEGCVYGISEDPKGNILVGVSEMGLTVIDPNTRRRRTLSNDPKDPASIGGNDLRDMTFDKDGNLWLMFHHNAVDFYEQSTDKYHHFISSENPISTGVDPWFFDLLIDSRERMWLCSSTGLWVFTDGVLDEKIMGYLRQNETLGNMQVNCIWEGSPDCYWVGTSKGLFCLNLNEQTIVSFTVADGLPSDQVNSINGVDDGTVWIATENGISHFDPQYREFVNYNKNDGLPTNGFYIGSTFRSKDGLLYFGGKHGVVRFRPEQIRRFKKQAPVLITGFKLYNREVEIAGSEQAEGAILTKAIEETEKIVLPFEPYTITFEFVVLSFRNAHENLFSYKLDGFDEEWSVPGKRRDYTYTNLSPGDYVFRVRARNSEGNWIEGETALSLVILPPIWERTWFRLLVVVLLVLSGSILYYIRVRFINEKRISLQRLVAEQTRQLREAMSESERQKAQIAEQNRQLMEQHHHLEERIRERTEELEISKIKAEESDKIKSAFLENISHEFRTPMNAILGGVMILCEEDLNKEEREYYASVILQNSDSLLKMIDDILDLSRMEAGEMPNQLTPIDIEFFCDQLYLKYQEYFRIQGKEGVELVLEKHPGTRKDSDLFYSDKGRLTQAISHLIENAIKFTYKGSIRFGYRFVEDLKETKIQFFVTDTGIGIPKAQIKYIFNQFTKFHNIKEAFHSGTGLGLSIVKKLTESMSGTIRVNSELGEGTEMILEFPYSESFDEE